MENNKLDEFKKNIVSKRVAVLGMGISNTPLVVYLRSLGADVTCFDRIEDEKLLPVYETLKNLQVKFHTGANYLDSLTGFDIIFKTPIIRYDIPALVKSEKEGAVVTSEMELFFELCPARIIGVTGSDGKTTTTTLIYKILVEQGFRCRLGGNIGFPLLDKIDEIRADELIILELSSYQLQTMKYSPDIAVITNISPNHLDVHTSFEEYVDAKKNIFTHQDPDECLILNFKNVITRDFDSEAKGNVIFFNLDDPTQKGVSVKDGSIYYNDGVKSEPIIEVKDIALRGWHNVENYEAAIAAVMGLAKPKAIRHVANTFKGVEHRMEDFASFNGITFINDSIATSPARTIAGLTSYDRKVILIAGGRDKNTDFAPLGPYILEYSKCLILIGETSDKIERSFRDAVAASGQKNVDPIPVIRCETYTDAVNSALAHATEGDVILFSPASTSFDLFRNFEERGNFYKKIVNEIISTYQ